MWRFKKYNNKSGFTFLEVLFSLIILSLILNLMSIVSQSYVTLREEVRSERNVDFFHFLSLFEVEINKYYVKNVTDKRLVIKDTSKNNDQYVILQNNKIYITPGHQPLLYDVKDWNLSRVDNRLYMVVVFNNLQSVQGSVEIKLYEDSIYGRE